MQLRSFSFKMQFSLHFWFFFLSPWSLLFYFNMVWYSFWWHNKYFMLKANGLLTIAVHCKGWSIGLLEPTMLYLWEVLSYWPRPHFGVLESSWDGRHSRGSRHWDGRQLAKSPACPGCRVLNIQFTCKDRKNVKMCKNTNMNKVFCFALFSSKHRFWITKKNPKSWATVFH